MRRAVEAKAAYESFLSVEKCLGRSAEMEMLPLQARDVPDTEADVSELMREVGYKPEVTVEIGVARFVEWYREYFGV